MKKPVYYLLHAFVILSPVLNIASNARSISDHYHLPLINGILDNLFIDGSFLALVYLSYWLFIPKYLLKKEYLKFAGIFLTTVFSFAIYLNISAFFISATFKTKTHVFDNGWMFGMALGWAIFFFTLGTIFRLFIQWFIDSQNKIELEKQNLKSELSMLKNQINPHFLFNSLNNIDSLINENSPIASQSLNKLAEIMRYMVYDTDKDFVSLQDELNYVANYIELQKLRIQNDKIIQFSINGIASNKQIAPMLLIPFIENVFKHSSLKDKSENKIEIKIEIIDDRLFFFCFNTIAEITKDKSSGIGLENVKKRLEMIYNNNHNLTIVNSEVGYTVKLDIKL